MCGGGQNYFYSDYGHVAYQIKGNDTNSNMEANILAVDTPLTPWVESQGQTFFFLKVVVLHI